MHAKIMHSKMTVIAQFITKIKVAEDGYAVMLFIQYPCNPHLKIHEMTDFKPIKRNNIINQLNFEALSYLRIYF